MTRLLFASLLLLGHFAHGTIEVLRPEDTVGFATVTIPYGHIDDGEFGSANGNVGYDANLVKRVLVGETSCDRQRRCDTVFRIFDRTGAEVVTAPISAEDIKDVKAALKTLPAENSKKPSPCPIKISYAWGGAEVQARITTITYTCNRYSQAPGLNRAG